MSKEDFLSQSNITLIWEVLTEDILKNKSRDELNKIGEKINQTIPQFYENEKHNVTNLMSLNKKFMTLMINYVNSKTKPKPSFEIENLDEPSHFMKTQPSQRKTNQTTQTNQTRPPITFEELQTQRIDNFDKQLTKMQDDFVSAITPSVPEIPNFRVTTNDEPMLEIDVELKKIMAQRNYDIEQITKSFNNNDNPGTFIAPIETSIKNEKNIKNANSTRDITAHRNYQESNKILINIDKNDISKNVYSSNEIIDLTESPKKRITWEDETGMSLVVTSSQTPSENDGNIFKKFKLLPGMLENDNVINNQSMNERKIENMETEILQIKNDLTEMNNKISHLISILLPVSK